MKASTILATQGTNLLNPSTILEITAAAVLELRLPIQIAADLRVASDHITAGNKTAAAGLIYRSFAALLRHTRSRYGDGSTGPHPADCPCCVDAVAGRGANVALAALLVEALDGLDPRAAYAAMLARFEWLAVPGALAPTLADAMELIQYDN